MMRFLPLISTASALSVASCASDGPNFSLGGSSPDAGPRDATETEDGPMGEHGDDAGRDVVVDAGCMPGETKPCYSGPAGTEGVGTCVAGVATCEPSAVWGPCIGEIDPVMDVCGGPDTQCDGHLPPQQCPGDIAITYPIQTGESQRQSVGVDPTTGNVVLVGNFNVSVDFGLGALTGGSSTTGYMLTFDPSLKPIAQVAFGQSQELSIAIDSMGNRFVTDFVAAGYSANLGGGSITAGPNGLEWFAMFDATGALTWSKPIQVPVDSNLISASTDQGGMGFVVSSANDENGGIYDYGCGAGTSNHDSALVVLGAAGACAWEARFGPDVTPFAVAAQSDGAAVLLGRYDGAAGVSLGTFPLTAGSKQDVIFAVKEGVVQWVDAFPASGLGFASVRIGQTDEIYVYADASAATVDLGGGPLPIATTTPDGDDVLIARFDPTGHYVWASRFAGDSSGVNQMMLAVGASALFVSATIREGHVNLGGGELSPALVGSVDLSGKYRWSVPEYTDTPLVGGVMGTSFLYVLTASGNVEQILY